MWPLDLTKLSNKSMLCAIAIIGIMTKLVFMGCKLGLGYCNDKKKLLESLNTEEKILYMDIKKERKKLACRSMLVGVVIAILYMALMAKLSMRTVWESLGVMFVVSSLMYRLSDKKMWLVHHLNTRHQRELWTKSYKMYSDMGSMGEILGLMVMLMM